MFVFLWDQSLVLFHRRWIRKVPGRVLVRTAYLNALTIFSVRYISEDLKSHTGCLNCKRPFQNSTTVRASTKIRGFSQALGTGIFLERSLGVDGWCEKGFHGPTTKAPITISGAGVLPLALVCFHRSVTFWRSRLDQAVGDAPLLGVNSLLYASLKSVRAPENIGKQQ